MYTLWAILKNIASPSIPLAKSARPTAYIPLRYISAAGYGSINEYFMIIRKAIDLDILKIIAIDQVAEGGEQQKQNIKKWVAEENAVVATNEDRVVGYAVLEYIFFGQGFITMLQVAEAYRRQGVARQLLTYLENVCRTDKLFTSTNDSNEPMQKLMEAVGYSPSGTVYNLDEGDPELFYFK